MDLNDAPALLQQLRSLTARLARHVGRCHAEDLAGEALLRSLRTPAPDGHQAPWIERICRNLRIDHMRAHARAVASLARAPEPTPMATPEDDVLVRERRDALLAAIPSIPVDLQDALIARFVEDRAYDEVATAEGISPATARTRVFRALGRLRVALGQFRAVLWTPHALGMKGLGAVLVAPALTAIVVLPSLVRQPAIDARPVPTLVAQRTTAPSHERRVPRASERSAGIGAAQPAPTSAIPPAGDAAVHKGAPPNTAIRRDPRHADATTKVPPAVQHFEYGDDQIDGESDKPPVDWVWGDPPNAVHSSLIEIPRSFASALTKTLEDL